MDNTIQKQKYYKIAHVVACDFSLRHVYFVVLIAFYLPETNMVSLPG